MQDGVQFFKTKRVSVCGVSRPKDGFSWTQELQPKRLVKFCETAKSLMIAQWLRWASQGHEVHCRWSEGHEFEPRFSVRHAWMYGLRVWSYMTLNECPYWDRLFINNTKVKLMHSTECPFWDQVSSNNIKVKLTLLSFRNYSTVAEWQFDP